MTITSPPAAANPAMYAAPYPRRRSCTTRAPAAAAASGEPSVEPLSTTMTSPATPASSIASFASRTTAATLSISFRQGRTTDTPSLTGVRLPVVISRKPAKRLQRPTQPGAPEVGLLLLEESADRVASLGGRVALGRNEDLRLLRLLL